MKNNNQELKVILSKVAWCGHCTNFLPVFNKSQKLTKNNKYLKDINVNFEVYDMEKDLNKFKSNNYEDLLPQINGYPTVIVTSLKNGKRVNTEIIDHSSDPLEFINTVGETYNKLVSQSGGYEEEFYKQKYLKYKQKYTELKEQIGGDKEIEWTGIKEKCKEELIKSSHAYLTCNNIGPYKDQIKNNRFANFINVICTKIEKEIEKEISKKFIPYGTGKKIIAKFLMETKTKNEAWQTFFPAYNDLNNDVENEKLIEGYLEMKNLTLPETDNFKKILRKEIELLNTNSILEISKEKEARREQEQATRKQEEARREQDQARREQEQARLNKQKEEAIKKQKEYDSIHGLGSWQQKLIQDEEDRKREVRYNDFITKLATLDKQKGDFDQKQHYGFFVSPEDRKLEIVNRANLFQTYETEYKLYKKKHIEKVEKEQCDAKEKIKLLKEKEEKERKRIENEKIRIEKEKIEEYEREHGINSWKQKLKNDAEIKEKKLQQKLIDDSKIKDKKRQEIKTRIINYTPTKSQNKDDKYIRNIFINTIEKFGQDFSEPISYENAINKIYEIKEYELKVLLDKLYFLDEDLYKFKIIFTVESIDDSKRAYNFFINKIS